MDYKSEFAVVPAGATDLVLAPITIYPTTDDFNVLRTEELQIYFDFANEDPLAYLVYFFTNTSDQTLLVPISEGEPVPFAPFPEASNGMGYEATNNSADFVPTGGTGGFAMPPSETPYGLIAFASIAQSKEIQLNLPIMLPMDTISIFLPEGMNAEGESLVDGGIQPINGANFHVYSAAPLKGGDTLTFTISGEPATVAASPDITQNQNVLIGIGAFGVTLILAGLFMYMRDRKKDEDEDAENEKNEDEEEGAAYEDAESTMDAIIALDDLHRAGKIGDDAYKKRRAELTSALKKGN